MRSALIAYAATLVVFLALDAVWLGTIALGLYRSRLGELLLERPNMAVAGLFYAVYVAGVVFFAVAPALQQGSWSSAVLHGAVLGFIAYATYDLTNLATLRGWPSDLALIDLAWGTLLTAASATGGYIVAAAFARG